jgi:HEAT repeat protein
MRQKEMPEGLGNLLIDVVGNSEQDGMWRNYCIQFMPEFYEKATEAGNLTAKNTEECKEENSVAFSVAGGERSELQEVREALWNALDERDNSNAGTALLGLNKLSRNHSEFDREEIDAAMVDLASDKEASVANRITAIRLCGEQGNDQALETTRDLSQNGDTTMLRCAAIASLGELGTEEDLALLETYAASNDERIQRIAQKSLGKLVSR